MYRKKTLTIAGLTLLTSLLSGCGIFSGPDRYFRDRSVDYTQEKEVKQITLPDNKATDAFVPVLPVPPGSQSLADVGQAGMDSNIIPAPANALMHAGAYSYQLVSTPEKNFIESDAGKEILWARIIGWLQAGHIKVVNKDKTGGLVETGWFVPEGQKKYGWLYRTYNQVFSKAEDQEKALALRFQLTSAKGKPDFFHVTVTASQKSAQSTAAIDWNNEKKPASFPLLKAVAQELLVYMVEHSGDQADTSQGYRFNANTMTKMMNDGNGNPLLKIQSGFDTAWTETGKALKRSGVHIRQANHAAGIYYIDLSLSEAENSTEKHQQREVGEAFSYRVVLAPVNDGVYVSLEKNVDTIAPVGVSKKVLTKLQKAMKADQKQT